MKKQNKNKRKGIIKKLAVMLIVAAMLVPWMSLNVYARPASPEPPKGVWASVGGSPASSGSSDYTDLFLD